MKKLSILFATLFIACPANRAPEVPLERELRLGKCAARVTLPGAPRKMHPFRLRVDLSACSQEGANAPLMLHPDMPGMSMGVAPIAAKQVAPGSYLADVVFTMAGSWHIVIRRGDDQAVVEVQVD